MGKKTRTQTVLSVLMMVFLLIGMIPGVAMAVEPDPVELGWLNFMSSADSTLITGVTSTINMKLYQDSTAEPFTGS
ncbi:MAG TPA: cell wall-binding repeat-containing protein, partial [Desulfosporosinus sp.]|nr:cell wall-binding repeat-containing protein [Desulfosporosinus sp.]